MELSSILQLAISCFMLFMLLKSFRYVYQKVTVFRYSSEFAGPKGQCLIGNTQQLSDLKTIFAFLIKSSQEYDKYFMLWFGITQPSLICYHHTTIKTILNANPPKLAHVYDFLSDAVGHGILTENGRRWARNRRLVTPGFHYDVLKSYVAVQAQTTDILLEKWVEASQSGRAIDLFYDNSLYTLDIILRCAFSVELNCQSRGKEHPYVASINEVTKLIAERIYNVYHHFDWYYYLTPTGRKLSHHIRIAQRFTESIIKKRQRELASNATVNNNKKHLDFLDILLTARYDDDKGLDFTEIRSEVDTFMFAGHDTTSSALSCTMFCLGKYPQHQEKIKDEVDTILQNKNNIEWEDLSTLKYTTLCIKEAMRIYATVPLLDRRLDKDIEIDGKILPAGAMAIISPFLLHRNPNVWEEPDKFDPQRFLPENSVGRHPYAYIPFSAGMRNCVGQNFALNVLKIAVAKIVHRYAILSEADEEITFTVPLVLKLHGFKVYLKERKNETDGSNLS